MSEYSLNFSLGSFSFDKSLNNVLGELRFDLKRGERVAIMGGSGTGKTTLVKLLLGLKDYIGKGDDISYQSSGKFSMIFQQNLLLEYLSVEDNINLPLKLNNEVGSVQDITNLLRIGNILDKYPYELSGGQQKRVAIARSLLTPNIVGVMMDEPLTGLDEPLKEDILSGLSSILDSKGWSCVLTTHNPFEAAFLADRVIFLSGSPARISQEYVVNTPREKRGGYIESKGFYEDLKGIQKCLKENYGY